MLTQGTTVSVQWYGKQLQGTVRGQAFPDGTPSMQRMLAVEIMLMGTKALAAFTPEHLRISQDVATPSVVAGLPSDKKIEDREKTTLLAIKHFKDDHWDYKHNHLKVGSLNDFYILWRNAHGGHRQEASVRPAPQPSHVKEAVPQNETTHKTIKNVTQLSLFE